MPYQPIDYGTDYYPSGDELANLRSTSSTYSNSNLTVEQERQRQLEHAGLTRDTEGRAVNPQRVLNSNTSKSRMFMPKRGSFLSKATGLEQFKPSSSQPVTTQAVKPIQATSNLPSWADDVTRQKEFNKLALERSQGLSAGELQANINRVKQYEPLANNEKNRALGMELATRLPYSSFEENLRSMRQAGVNATNMTNSISGAYSNSVSKLNPVSMSL